MIPDGRFDANCRPQVPRPAHGSPMVQDLGDPPSKNATFGLDLLLPAAGVSARTGTVPLGSYGFKNHGSTLSRRGMAPGARTGRSLLRGPASPSGRRGRASILRGARSSRPRGPLRSP